MQHVGGPAICHAARKVAAQKLDELQEKMASLRAMQASLRPLVATCAMPPAQRECPLLGALDNGDAA
jgi:hypothetical protein